MVKNTNKRINVLVNKETCIYLNQIVNIYNTELEKKNFYEKQNRHKLNLSALYQIAIGNLIIQIDKNLDTKKSIDYNHKKIYEFLAG